MSRTVRIEKIRIPTDQPRPADDLRPWRQSMIRARAPVKSIKKMASIAAPSCLVIRSAETPEAFLTALWAPIPLKKAGSVSRAINAKIIRLARLRSSFRLKNEPTSSPRPIIVPMIGKWLSKRCRCARFMNAPKPSCRLTRIRQILVGVSQETTRRNRSDPKNKRPSGQARTLRNHGLLVQTGVPKYAFLYQCQHPDSKADD